ncbi:MAG: hypothetical protein WD048_09285 [Chitinophagales bacterium]
MALINFKELRNQRDFKMIFLDLFMVVLVLVNMAYIIVEFNFETEVINGLLYEYLPKFHTWYDVHLHKNFLYYDTIFVSIFLAELFIRWGLAIKRDTYAKWFFYPFVHWYDVLGCIPLGAFRALRILRIISIIVRLHKLKVINVREWYIYTVFVKYSNILAEEISDRVVVNVISGIQDEVKSGGVTADKILNEVILPQKPFLVDWLSHRIQHATAKTHVHLEQDLKNYIDSKVQLALYNNPEVKNLERIPVVGGAVAKTLGTAVSDVTFNVINGIIKDLSTGENKAVIEDIADLTLDAIMTQEKDEELDKTIKKMVHASLEVVKAEVQVKQWLIDMEEEKKAKQIAKEG